MNIEVGREFVQLAQTLSFTQTAKQLNITQPALSKHILALEKEFGIELLVRGRGGIQLTEAGQLLFEKASAMVQLYDEARSALDAMKVTLSVRVGGHLDDSDIASLLAVCATLARKQDGVRVVYDRSVNKSGLELLASDDVDMAVCYLTQERIAAEGFNCRPFLALPLAAVMDSANPLAVLQGVTWDQLRGETLLKFVSGKTNEAFEQISSLCLRHGFEPKVRNVTSQNDIEFFSTPLQGSVLIWKRTQREIAYQLDTGHRAAIPIVGDDALLQAYVIYKPEREAELMPLFQAIDAARDLAAQHDSAR
jgi:DNA-binding transcriptional LysR family regulator